MAGVVVLRDRRRRSAAERPTALHPVPVEAVGDKYEGPMPEAHEANSGAAYAGVLRILWWLTIAVVLVGVGISGAYASA